MAMEDIKKQVGDMIAKARKGKRMTQKGLSEGLGVTRSVVSNYEAGNQNLTIDTLRKIADVLEVELTIRMG